MSQTSGASPSWRGSLLGAVDAASGRAFGYVSLGLVTGSAALALWITAVVVGLSFALLIVGLPVALGCFLLLRAGADVERWRAAFVFGAPIARPYQPVSGGVLHRLVPRGSAPASRRGPLWLPGVRSARASWRDLLWLVVLFPLGTATAVVSWTLWGVGLGLLFLPLYYRFLPGGGVVYFNWDGQNRLVVDSFTSALPYALLGLAFCWVAGWTTRGMALGQAWLARALLGPSRVARLGERVATLAATRATAAD